MARHQALIRESAAFLAEEAGISWSEDDPALARVLLHLRLAIEMIVSGKAETNPVLDRIRSEYPERSPGPAGWATTWPSGWGGR